MPRRDATRAAPPLRAADVAPRQNSAATKVTDEATMNHVAEAYRAKYGWPVTVTDGAFDTLRRAHGRAAALSPVRDHAGDRLRHRRPVRGPRDPLPVLTAGMMPNGAGHQPRLISEHPRQPEPRHVAVVDEARDGRDPVALQRQHDHAVRAEQGRL